MTNGKHPKRNKNKRKLKNQISSKLSKFKHLGEGTYVTRTTESFM